MKKPLFIILAAVIAAVLVFLVLRFISGEDNWICRNGEWVKHGNPKVSMPNKPCSK